MTAHTDAVEALKPCPFCGAVDVAAFLTDPGDTYVSCNCCGAAGPAYPAKTEAIAAWNRRTPASMIAQNDFVDGKVVTNAMIQAGVSAFLAWQRSDDPYSANAVISIYRAMVATPTAVPGSAGMREAAVKALKDMPAFPQHVGAYHYDDETDQSRPLTLSEWLQNTHVAADADDLLGRAADAILALITPDRERIRAEAFEEAARAAEGTGRLVGMGDGDTYTVGSATDAARAIRSLASKERGDG